MSLPSDEHREARNRHLQCSCGYQATCQADLDDHIVEMTR